MQKNADSEKVKEIIICEVEQNHRLLQLVGTPLMATRLIEIVRDLNELPKSEGLIIKKFLESLYKREKFEKKDIRFDEIKIDFLLTQLALYGFLKNGTNSGLSYYEVLECFANCMEKYHFSYDSTYALDILLHLGVLTSDRDREVIVFAHQAYQDYYLSCAEKNARVNEHSIIPSQLLNIEPSKISTIKTNEKEVALSEFILKTNKGTLIDSTSKELKQRLEKKQAHAWGGTITDERDAFYKEFANDEKHEKSIVYRLHNTERMLRNEEIKLLATHNLLLAAKVVSSGEPDKEIEEYIIGKALENIQDSSEEKQFESILVFLELDRTEELKDNISLLIRTGKNETKTLSNIAMKLSGEQCVVFLDALSQQDNIKNLAGVVSIVLNVFKLNDYEYSWSDSNLDVIKRIANRLNDLFKSSPYNLLLFYITFNVPKDYLIVSISNVLRKAVLKHSEIVEEFVKKYSYEFDMSPEQMINLGLHSGGHNSKSKAFLMIGELDSNTKYNILCQYLPKNWQVRSAVYLQLPDEEQYEITKRYNVYYNNSLRSNRIKDFLTKEEAVHLGKH